MASQSPGQPESDAQPDAGDRGSGVRLRPALAGLPRYVPGSGGVNASVFKLSSNELPGPVLPAVTSALVDTAEEVNRYPQMYADELTAAIADRHHLSPEQVLVGNGSVALIELLLRSVCDPDDEVVYPWRSFEAYPILVQATGARSRQVPASEDGSHDLAAMLTAITERTRVVIVCSPNNPTSTALAHQELQTFLAQVPAHVMVILDEAYVDFVRQAEPIDSRTLLNAYKNLVVVRTFSKAYGLAGLRVGYALARRRLVGGLRAASTPFGVSALAQVGARTALQLTEQVAERVQEVVTERERVITTLRHQGWQLPEAQGNFYWLPIGDGAIAFADAAAAAGVMVRPFAGDGVRITVGEPEANDIALRVARQWLEHRPGQR